MRDYILIKTMNKNAIFICQMKSRSSNRSSLIKNSKGGNSDANTNEEVKVEKLIDNINIS